MPSDLNLALRIRADVLNAVRGLQRVDAGVGRVGSRAHTTSSQLAVLNRNLARAERGLDRMGREAAQASRRVDGMGASLRRARLAAATFVASVGTFGIAAVGREIAQAGVAVEAWESRLRAATGSSETAASELAFLRDEAERLGLDFGVLADNFSLFAAATRGTALEGAQTREIFISIAEAARAMHLDVNQLAGVMNALTQIVSKGTVSSEEMRQQLGDRLPGAFQLAARAMGVTASEFSKMLALGEVMADELLPLLARELRATFGESLPEATSGAAAAFARMGNAIRELKETAAESGLLDFFADLAESVTGAARSLAAAGRQPQTFADVVEGVREADREIERLRKELDDPDNFNITAGIRLQIENEQEAREQLVALLPENVDQTRENAIARLAAIREAGNEGVASAVTRELEQTVATSTALIDESQRQFEEGLQRALADRSAAFNPPRPPTSNISEDLLDDLGDAEIKVLGTYERMIAEAEKWRDETLEKVDETDVGFKEFSERVDAVYAERVRQAEEKMADEAARTAAKVQRAKDRERAARLAAAEAAEEAAERIAEAQERAFRESRDPRIGALRGLQDIGDFATDAAINIEFAFHNAFGAMEDAIVEFASTGKTSIADLVDSILADLARIVVRQNIIGPLAQALAALFAPSLPGAGVGLNAGTVGSNIAHSGAIAGGARVSRQVSPLAFAGAQYFHRGGIAGLRPDEVPTILRRDEGVFTPEQMAALGPRVSQVDVRIVNENGNELEATHASAQIDGDRLIVGVNVADIAEGGELDRTLRNVYGLRRRSY